MIKKFIKLFVIIIPTFCFSQKQGNIWYFGIQSGIDFSSGVPVPLPGGMTGTDIGGDNQEGTACISDSSGNLLFYTGGCKTIWNRNHVPMPNGTGLMGGSSSTQTSMIIPLPGSDSLFFVFTSDEFQSYSHPPQKGYRYSVVNMCLDNGNGDVILTEKNVLLLDSSTEKLAACKDANGNGYWILGHKMYSNQFNAWHLTSLGITNIVISRVGTIHGWDIINSVWNDGAAQGQMKFNPSGTKLALVLGNSEPAVLDLFDFDKITGSITNFCHFSIDSAAQARAYGVEFSPDGSKLYVGVAYSFGKYLYQFDLLAGGGNCSSIFSSRTKIFQSSSNSVIFGMQLAPNNKIYLVGNNYYTLSCINAPNATGVAANFDSSAIAIPGIGGMSLPAFISGYQYCNQKNSCAAGNGLKNYYCSNRVLTFPNPTSDKVIFSINADSIQNVIIDIFDSKGQVICSERALAKSNIEINSSIFSPGIYFVKISIGAFIVSGSFIKE